MATDERRLESLAIEWIIQQVRARRRMKDTLPIEGAMTVPLEWAESLANIYEGMAIDDTRPPYDDLAAIVRVMACNGTRFVAYNPPDHPGDPETHECLLCGATSEHRRTLEHAATCPVERARALAARLPPG